jgi:hypothetical protein
MKTLFLCLAVLIVAFAFSITYSVISLLNLIRDLTPIKRSESNEPLKVTDRFYDFVADALLWMDAKTKN